MRGKKIIELPKHVADKIAAGEVVDRPVSVVKELVENAIDAGANFIVVEIKQGGKSYIRVTDNGSGIAKEDAEVAFSRHATSKISEAKDLDNITTLGFRGEALASIAAVSCTELITKTENEKTGINLKITGGSIVQKSEIGCPDGTTLIISNLFFNTPARLKFLKQDSTEAGLIIDLVSKVSLAYPNIRFRMINNGNVIFSTSGNGSSYQNILNIYGAEIGGSLLKAEAENEIMQLEAYISPPSISKTTRKNQIFFVNGRYVKNHIIEKAVSNAYFERLFDGRYPIAFVFLKIRPDKLDVNIHPNKKEIRFDNEAEVQDWIEKSLKKVLNSVLAIPPIKSEDFFKFSYRETKIPCEENQVDIKSLQETRTAFQSSEQSAAIEQYIPELLTTSAVSDTCANESSVEQSGIYSDIASRDSAETMRRTEAPFDMLSLSVLGSVFGTYIIVCDSEQIYLIDQHAAHERIIYEELLTAFYNNQTETQRLLNPFIVEVSFSSKYEIANCLDFIEKIGFEIESFGVKSYIVKSIPAFMSINEAKCFLEDMMENIFINPDFKNRKNIEKLIASSCKKAIKANDNLDKLEIRHLIKKLALAQNPFSCPHGRPVFIKLSRTEIEKMFKRI